MRYILTLLQIPGGHLREISVIIPFHFQVENLAFCLGSIGNEVLVKKTLKIRRKAMNE